VWLFTTVAGRPFHSSHTRTVVRVCFEDLSVIFDPELSFSQHCKEKINKAYAMLGIIKRNLIYLSEEAFVSLYKSSWRRGSVVRASVSDWRTFPDMRLIYG